MLTANRCGAQVGRKAKFTDPANPVVFSDAVQDWLEQTLTHPKDVDPRVVARNPLPPRMKWMMCQYQAVRALPCPISTVPCLPAFRGPVVTGRRERATTVQCVFHKCLEEEEAHCAPPNPAM